MDKFEIVLICMIVGLAAFVAVTLNKTVETRQEIISQESNLAVSWLGTALPPN